MDRDARITKSRVPTKGEWPNTPPIQGFSDRDLLTRYQYTNGIPGDLETEFVLAEIKRRGLDT